MNKNNDKHFNTKPYEERELLTWRWLVLICLALDASAM